MPDPKFTFASDFGELTWVNCDEVPTATDGERVWSDEYLWVAWWEGEDES